MPTWRAAKGLPDVCPHGFEVVAIIAPPRGTSPPTQRAVSNPDLHAIRAAREARETLCRECPKFVVGAVECGRVVRHARCREMSACQWMHMMSSGAGKWPEECAQPTAPVSR